MMQKEIKPNPFTPKSGWEPKVFAGREREIEVFKKKLEEATKGRCDHFLVLGEWGIGKTSLLKEFKKIAQQQNILASLVTVSEYKKESLREGVQELIEQIPKKLPISVKRLRNFFKYINSLGVQLFGSGFNFSKNLEGIQPSTLLLDTLLNLWSDLKKETKTLVILLDDVQNFSEISNIFTLIKNVLSDDEVLKTKILVGLSCTYSGWEEFLQKHHPIGRYFTPRLEIKKLNEEETRQAITESLRDSGVVFEKRIVESVWRYTGGHPYELQILCYFLYENQISGEVDNKVWDSSLEEALVELGKRVFDSLYERASPQEQKILHVLSSSDKSMTRKEIIEFAKKKNLKLAEGTIHPLITRLLNKSLLVSHSNFKYSLPDQFFREYLLKIRGYDAEGNLS